MEKINLKDKYIHSPNWENRQSDYSFGKFKRILKSGYLLKPEESGIRTRYYDDRVFFAVHPQGPFADEYPAAGLASFSNDDGYKMASKGFFFILNPNLRNDYDLEPVKYKYECATKNNVDLFKYLEGIGNAGLNISDKLAYCYYYIKYINDEISKEDVIEVVNERNLDVNLDMSLDIIGKSIGSLADPRYNYLNQVLESSIEDLIEVENYYRILEILNELDKKINLYDRYGYLVNPENRIEEVNKMYEYVEKNKDIQFNDLYFRKIKKLVNN